ncbi:MAG: hypothetical protein QHH14_13405 [Clostridiales bacterium]|nr:hypothetical protein [Clostridiales bacterium]
MTIIKRIGVWALVSIPFLFLVLMVARYKVDVPEWDQWALVPLLEKSYGGTLTLKDFWFQHNEHRLVFPKLLMVPLARLSGWNISYELALSILLAAGIFFCLAIVMKKTFASVLGARLRWPFIFLSLVVFSLNQVENWMWGWNIQIFLNVLAGAGAIVLLTGKRLGWREIAGAALLSIVAAFSYASGLVFSLIGFAAIIFSVSLTKKRRLLYSLLWLSVSTAIFYSYFYHYHSPSHHPSLSSILNSPLNYMSYVLTYLGAALLSSDVNPFFAFLAGLAGVILFGLTVLMILSGRKIRAGDLSPYLFLSLYALATALLTGLGRAGFGAVQAMSPRYVAFSSLFWISLVVFIIILLKMDGSKTEATPKPAKIILASILALIFSLSATSSFHSRVLFKERYRRLEPARRELSVFKNKELLERIYPHLGEVDWREMERAVEFLRSKRLSVFRPAAR